MAGQAVLIGVGVGDGSASILAASLTWLFKGMLPLLWLYVIIIFRWSWNGWSHFVCQLAGVCKHYCLIFLIWWILVLSWIVNAKNGGKVDFKLTIIFPHRIFADVLNDLAFFLEIFSLHTVSLFTALVCVASVMRVR